MTDQNFCQSCGMPMQGNNEIQGTNLDGSKNAEYCVYCFKNGAFTADLSMEEMVRRCVPHMLAAYTEMTEAQAEQMMMVFFPTLKRWRTNEVKEIFCSKAFYIALDGEGALNLEQSYEESIKALYTVFFALQKNCKAKGQELFVLPPHTLWWLENGDDFEHTPREKWHWRNMLEVSNYVSETDVEVAKKSEYDTFGVALLQDVKLWEMNEGKVLQVLHTGPYEMLCDTVSRLHEVIEKGCYIRRGWHHDIYLNDPKTTDPSELQTLIRLPVYREMDESLDFQSERDTLLQAIGPSKIMTLSTMDGVRVSSRNMSLIIIDGKFYFQTALEFRKCKDMEKNQHVALCAENFQVEGVVTSVHSLYDTDVAAFKKLYQQHHEKSYTAYSKLMGNRVFEITPVRAQLYCYENGGAYIKIIDFIAKKAGKRRYI